MTDSERHAIIGKLFEDRHEARVHLCCLEAKKDQLSKSLERINREYLQPEISHPGSGFTIAYPKEEDLFSLIEDLKSARGRLSDLESRCRELGLD